MLVGHLLDVWILQHRQIELHVIFNNNCVPDSMSNHSFVNTWILVCGCSSSGMMSCSQTVLFHGLSVSGVAVDRHMCVMNRHTYIMCGDGAASRAPAFNQHVCSVPSPSACMLAENIVHGLLQLVHQIISAITTIHRRDRCESFL